MLTNLIEALCDWVWKSFDNTDDTLEKNWVLDQLESASVAAENGNRQFALWFLEGVVWRVFGVFSKEYLWFCNFFPEVK